MPLRTTGTNVLKDRKNLTKRKDAGNNVRVDASDNVRIRELTNPIYFGAAGWWDFSNQDYLIIDTTGSDTVQQANDITGNGNHWVQGTKANQPAWTIQSGANKGAEFDGSTAWMQVASPTITGANHIYILAVLDTDADTNNKHVISEANGDFRLSVNASEFVEVDYNIGGASSTADTADISGTLTLVEVMIDGAHVEIYVDGTQNVQTAAAGDLATTAGAWYLGGSDAGVTTADLFTGHVMELIVIPRGDKISPKEQFFLRKLFADKWSITL